MNCTRHYRPRACLLSGGQSMAVRARWRTALFLLVALNVTFAVAGCTGSTKAHPQSASTTTGQANFSNGSGITGTLIARGGKTAGAETPVSGDVMVTAGGSDVPLVTVHADASGRWIADVPPGRYEVSADMGGNLQTSLVNVDPHSYSSVTLVFELV